MPTELERLYREHRAGLVRLVERELHDHHDAEDVVQTAFLDAQRALDRGTTPRNPRAWLAAIALNAGRRLRRRRVNTELLHEVAAQEASPVPEIHAALASLPREQRTAVVYRDVLGLTYDETAEQMGKSVDAVTMLLHRGRRRLRQTLGVTTGVLGLRRLGKRAGIPQVAAVKCGAAVVVAAGLATTGVVAGRMVAPIGSEAAAAAPVTRAGSRTAEARPMAARLLRFGPSTLPASTQGPSGDATTGSVAASTAEVASSLVSSTLGVPTVSVPKLPVPTAPAVAATVTVSTPVATVTAATPTGTTATVTTPITTVTLPVP